MATILCLTGDVPGTLYAGVELSRRLSRAGHRVIHAGFAGARRTAESNGLDFLELEASVYDDFLAADDRWSPWRRLRRMDSRRRRAIESLGVGGLAQAVRDVDPDLLVIDCELHEHVIATSDLGVPTALLSSFVSIWRRPGLPPPHHLALPGVGFEGSRLGCWLLWSMLRMGKWRRAWRRKIQRVGCDRLSLLRRLALEHECDLRRRTDPGQWIIPFVYRDLPYLSTHALEFDFPHRPPPQAHALGPLVLADRGEGEAVESCRAELEAIGQRARDAQRVVIYAGFGSFLSVDPGFLRRLLAAVGERSDWELVLSLGGRMRSDELGPTPDRVHVFDWVPQLAVLRHAAVAVTHGGINTIDECVLAGVPVLIYHGGETDMAGNTSRVVYHGIGLAGRRRDDAPAIGRRIDRLLREPSFRSAVERLRTSYLRYGERQVAETTVDSLLAPARAGTAN